MTTTARAARHRLAPALGAVLIAFAAVAAPIPASPAEASGGGTSEAAVADASRARAAEAAPGAGAPDPNFGTGGLATVPGADRRSGQGRPLVQRDGRIVAASLLSSASDTVHLSRFTADGAPDPGFGSGGSGTSTGIGAPMKMAATALAPDDSIFVAGGSTSGGTVTVGRYTADGLPDASWNRTGRSVARLNGAQGTFPTALLVQPDGKVVVALRTKLRGKHGFTVARFTQAGALDAAFGGGQGYVQVLWPRRHAAAFDLARIHDGRLLLAGALLDKRATTPVDTALVRLLPDGRPDTGFGSGGRAVHDLAATSGGADGALGVAALPTGGLFLTGQSGGGGVVAKLTSTGALDAGFGGGGMVLSGLAPAGARFTGADVVIDEAGRPVVTGTVHGFGGATSATRWSVARLLPAGARPLDGTFGTAGVATLDLCANRTAKGPSGVARGPGATLLVAGSCGDDGRSAVVRLLGEEPVQGTAELDVTPPAQAAGYQRIAVAGLDPTAVLRGGEGLQSAPFRTSPFRTSPFRTSPFRTSPFRTSPFRTSPLALALPETVLLSEVPLIGTTWDFILRGSDLEDAPLQTLTLRRVLDADPPNLATLFMSDFDLDRTPLRNVSLAALLLSPRTLSQLPPPDGGWCAFLAGQPADCDHGVSPDRSTLLSLELAGDDLAAYYRRPLLLAGVPSGQAEGRSVLARVPLVNVDLGDTPFGGLPAAAVSSVMTGCGAGCPGTVADRQRDDPTGFSTADLGELLDLLPIAGGPQDVSLGQVLLGLVGSEEIPFERTPLRDLLDAAERRDQRLQTYTVAFEGGCGPGTSLAVDVALPGDARMVPGSATLAVGTGPQEPQGDPAAGSVHAFDVGAVCAGTPSGRRAGRLRFLVEPGSSLGAAGATAVVRGTHTAPAAAGAAVTVEDGDDGPHPLAPGVLRTGHISSKDDVDTFTVTAPAPGARVTVTLAHLPADYDLVVTGPPIDAEVSPFRTSPFRTSPFRTSPVPDASQEPVDSTRVAPNAVQDVPFRTSSEAARGVSIKRGNADESVTILARPGDDRYTVRVAGYDGASAPAPYVIRSSVVEAPPAPPCAARPALDSGSPGQLPAAIPQDTRTLVLMNEQRLRNLYGDADVDDMLDAFANRYLGRDEVRGVLLPVEGDRQVAASYRAWDSAPCSVDAANDVVRAIGDLVDGFRRDGGLPQLRNVVLVGPDAALPQMRVADESRLANESTFAEDMVFNDLDDAVSRALREGNLLTDDVHADFDPQSLGSRQLYIPDAAVARMVETPEDVQRAIDEYHASDGILVETNGFVAGYEFLRDGSKAIFDGIEPLFAGGAGLDSAINDAWNREVGIGGMEISGGISSVNAHMDTYRAMPADAFTNNTPDLWTAAEVDPHPRTLLFTIGCHSGLNVAAAGLAGAPADDPRLEDFTERIAGSGALWVAETGYGLGDSTAVAYSERLMASFAEMLGQERANIGQSLMYAKQDYAATTLGVMDDYDVKTLQQATLYGLPTYVTAGGTTAEPPAPAALSPSSARASRAATGASSIAGTSAGADDVFTRDFTFEADPDDFEPTTTDRGTYYTVDGEPPLVVQQRPIQPRATQDVTAGDGKPVHGALVDQLEMITVTGVDPAIARPTIDFSEHEPEPSVTDAPFPASLSAVSPLLTPEGRRDRLALFVGQFRGTDQRLFTRMAGRVLRSSSDDYDPPRIDQVDAVVGPGAASFSVETPDGDASGGVVLFRADAPGQEDVWRSVELGRTGPGRLGAATTLPPGATLVVEWTVQLADDSGNVGVSTNKVLGYVGRPLPPAGEDDPEVTLEGPTEQGYHTAPPSVGLDDRGRDATFEYSIDGGAWQPFDGEPFEVGGEGVHIVRFRGTDGSTAARAFVIDTQPPVLTATATTAPNDRGWYRGDVTVHFFCADAGSGLDAAGCPPPVTVTEGEGAGIEVHGSARDRVGRVGEVTLVVDIDRTDPDGVVIHTGEGGDVHLTGDEELEGEASDRVSGVQSVLVTYVEDLGEGSGDGKPAVVRERVPCPAVESGEEGSCSWSAPRPPDGVWEARASAEDRAGRVLDGEQRVTVVSGDATAGDLIVNGSFEQPALSPGGRTDPLPSIPGWTLDPSGAGTGIEVQNQLFGFQAFEGQQVVELDSDAPSRFYQDVPTTGGRWYRLDLAWSPRPGTIAAENAFAVSITGVDEDHVYGPQAGEEGTAFNAESIVFRATGGVTRVTFSDLGLEAAPGVDDDVGALLDGVHLGLVGEPPEP